MGWMFLLPVILWVLLAYALFVLFQGPVEHLSAWVGGMLGLPMEESAEGGLWEGFKAFINGARELIVLLLLKLFIAYLLFTFNKYIVLVLLAPLLAYASERTEEVLTGNRFPFSWAILLRDAWRGVRIAVRNGFLELVITVLLWVVTLLVPLVVPITAPLLFMVSAYFYGFSTFDYVFERRRFAVRESVRAINARAGAVLANGALFALLMKVPLLGMMCAPLMGTVGAVLSMRGELVGGALPIHRGGR
jgi:CysZ protein